SASGGGSRMRDSFAGAQRAARSHCVQRECAAISQQQSEGGRSPYHRSLDLFSQSSSHPRASHTEELQKPNPCRLKSQRPVSFHHLRRYIYTYAPRSLFLVLCSRRF